MIYRGLINAGGASPAPSRKNDDAPAPLWACGTIRQPLYNGPKNTSQRKNEELNQLKIMQEFSI